MSWVSPTGYIDTSNDWTNESNSYDNNTATYAYVTSNLGAKSWSGFIELTHASMACGRIRFKSGWTIYGVHSIDIDVYYSGAWHNLFEGQYPLDQWVEKSFSIQSITKFRFRYWNNCPYEWTWDTPKLYEVDFLGIPVVTVQAVTDILSTTATGNGNITDTGENATKRGICWSTSQNPTVADDKVEEEGSFGNGSFTGDITGLNPGTKYYVRAYAYNSSGYGYGTQVDFTTDTTSPTVTVQDPTYILPTTATANGNITEDGGLTVTERGFEYGLTKTNTWEAHDIGSFGEGAYTKGLTNLVANTIYWIRSYAVNGDDTSYSDWISFQTSAAGVIPTGTKIEICGDYTGYTYKSQRAETDDGEAYTAYFVISTDLSNKQALAIYKRILDLHLYFKSEDSGTATITVKRDNEADWQAVGSVSLTGTAEIIVKHLATRIYAKHFLFKISAANKFRFLGCLFEFLPEGMR